MLHQVLDGFEGVTPRMMYHSLYVPSERYHSQSTEWIGIYARGEATPPPPLRLLLLSRKHHLKYAPPRD
jgi:hypothetical protein